MTSTTTESDALRISLPLLIPLGMGQERLTAYMQRSLQVEKMTDSIPAELPVWDQTKPLTKAVLRHFADHGARQFTTDPTGSLIFSQIRDHDITYFTFRVGGEQRAVTADDLLAEQFTDEQRDSEMFLAALSGAPVFFRMPGGHRFSRIARLNSMHPVSVRVVVFLDGPRIVQFQPEYRD